MMQRQYQSSVKSEFSFDKEVQTISFHVTEEFGLTFLVFLRDKTLKFFSQLVSVYEA